ncbi:response regulator transcription factor [Pedobacter sp. ISL-68]|uniref:LytR/AlgR family response regulator transcription factor n=1 Tax=unclassified Pedobacter TaxID=2628915 RepID=UPI001BE95EC8|nr:MULTISPECIES: LytTR family DNA-binding domain-containing protein [unclassified Pedobacter]MBT2560722.1 response regulator transcription factor [Pedobacter sp. ISL-64]MBT2590101.1 response regulator transcription factor [Pedobacter sp. ISL-68]
MSLTCFIIDDEYHSIEVLDKYVNQTPGLKLIGSSTNPLLALEELCNIPTPDIVLLDVDMPQLNGLDVADLIGSASNIVFTTSYREYAPEAFEKDAVDYLLKPINYARFLKAITKVRLNLSSQTNHTTASPFFFVKSNIKGKFNRITIAEIRYIENMGNYIIIHMNDEKVITYLTLAEVLSKLPVERFSRIHQSYIVNHAVIHSLEYAQVRLNGEVTIPIGGTYRSAFREKIQPALLISKRDKSDH